MEPAELTKWIKARAHDLGFALVGVSQEVPKEAADFYNWWIEQGFAGEMSYLARHKEKKRSIGSLVPEAKAAIVCILPFSGSADFPTNQTSQVPAGKIARYAQGTDYHTVLEQKLKQLAQDLDKKINPSHASRVFVDSGPVNERALAANAGLGWVGKNSMLIHPEWGSWFWIGEIITQAHLLADKPINDFCGKCTRCLDACPTQAILPDKRAIDAQKCISYLNIEKRGPIDPALGVDWQGWLVGCDICQEVCPWNAHSLKKGRQFLGPPPVETVSLEKIKDMSQEDFKATFKWRAIERVKLIGLQRNAEILKNQITEKTS